MTLRTGFALLSLLALGGCVGSSPAAVLEPGVFGITSRGGTQAAMVERGVAAANRHCAADGRVMAPIRTEIGGDRYTIAFRCLPPGDPILSSRGIVPLPREERAAGR